MIARLRRGLRRLISPPSCKHEYLVLRSYPNWLASYECRCCGIALAPEVGLIFKENVIKKLEAELRDVKKALANKETTYESFSDSSPMESNKIFEDLPFKKCDGDYQYRPKKWRGID